jgi:hypothetical protein
MTTARHNKSTTGVRERAPTNACAVGRENKLRPRCRFRRRRQHLAHVEQATASHNRKEPP